MLHHEYPVGSTLIDYSRDIWTRYRMGWTRGGSVTQPWVKIKHLFAGDARPLPVGTVICGRSVVDGVPFDETALTLDKDSSWTIEGSFKRIIPLYGDRILGGWTLYDGTEVDEIHLGDEIVKNWWKDEPDTMGVLHATAVHSLAHSAVKTFVGVS